jgi:hypothetical protein
MKKYYLHVISGGVYKYEVYATTFQTQTFGSKPLGYYAFYDDKELVGCYPINKTVIVRIDENVDVQ